MGNSTQPERHVRFAEFELDLSTRELRVNGQKLVLQEQPFQILAALLERPGQLVTHDELRQRLWSSDTFVDFQRSLHKAVNRLRDVLEDSADEPRFIETLPRQGYRFIASTVPGRTNHNDAISEARAGNPRWLLIACTLALTAIAVGVFQLANRTHRPSVVLPELKQQQLTDNVIENPVSSGAVSADGKYLAYADLKGIHIKLIETGETANLPEPDEVKGKPVSWKILSPWVFDGTRLVADAYSPGYPPSIWTIPLLGGVPHKIRDNADAQSVSRDGTKVAFLSNWGNFGYREIWMMGPDGSGVQKLYDTDEKSAFYAAEWAPDGTRLAYYILHEAPQNASTAVQVRDLKGGPAVTVLPNAIPVEEYSWMPDGRLIYVSDEPGPAAENCNLWVLGIDSRSGQPDPKPKRLTNWAGFCATDAHATADSKRLVFRRWTGQANIYVGDLDPGGSHMTALRRLTLVEGRTFPASWTNDSKTVIFSSYREGQWRILKQPLDGETAEPIATATDTLLNPQARLSADGAWILYPDQFSGVGGFSTPYQLMRLAISGGRGEPVLSAHSYDAVKTRIAPACARAPATLCTIAERSSDGKRLTFTAFDPLQGRPRELVGVPLDPTEREYVWDLSPDGTRVALISFVASPPDSASAGRQIRIIRLDGQSQSEITVKGWDALQSVNWSADGKTLFVFSATADGSALLHVDLQGNARVIWKHKGCFEPWFAVPPSAMPSPDGRHLAIYDWSVASNIWMMENF